MQGTSARVVSYTAIIRRVARFRNQVGPQWVAFDATTGDWLLYEPVYGAEAPDEDATGRELAEYLYLPDDIASCELLADGSTRVEIVVPNQCEAWQRLDSNESSDSAPTPQT